jgi:hypothetical protein
LSCGAGISLTCVWYRGTFPFCNPYKNLLHSHIVVLKLYPKEGGSFVVFFFPNIEAAGNLPVGGGGNDLSAAG